MGSFWRCKSRFPTMSVACLPLQWSIAQWVERNYKVASPILSLFQRSTVRWIPGKIKTSAWVFFEWIFVTHYVAIGVTAIIRLGIKLMVVIMTRAGGTRVSSRHCARWRRKRTFDVLQCTFLFRYRNLERTINRVCVLDGCGFATRSIMLSIVLVRQVLKLYSYICTWEA